MKGPIMLSGVAVLAVLWAALGDTYGGYTYGGGTPAVSVFTATTWHPGVGGGAFYHDGVITQLGSVTERAVWEIDVDDYGVTRVFGDTCGWAAPPCPKIPQTASFGIAWTGRVAYLLGGAQQWLEDLPTPKIFRYDPEATRISDTGLAVPVLYAGDQALWTDGVAAWHPVTREVALFGGGNHEHYLDAFVVLDPARGTVERRSTLPQTSDNGCAVYWPERESFVWGMGHSGGRNHRAVYEVQPSGAWRKLGDMPIGIDYPACMITRGHLVVAGGQVRPLGDDVPGSEPSDAVYLMDLASGAAWQAATLPVPFMAYSSATDGDRRLWLVSGGDRIVLVQVD